MEISILLKEAKKYINDPDIIIDMFDKSICWMSKKGLKMMSLPKSDIIGKMAYVFFDTASFNEAAKIGAKDNAVTNKGVNEYPIKTKNGTLSLKFEFFIFQHNSILYYVGKLISSKPYKKNNQ